MLPWRVRTAELDRRNDGHSDDHPGSDVPVELHSDNFDQLLFDAFTRARRRFRGAVVAISERTMITNASASELLRPLDRRQLCRWAQSLGNNAIHQDVPLELTSGLTVQARCHAVEFDGRPVGYVLHLSVNPSADGALAIPGATGSLLSSESPGVPALAESASLTIWSDLTDTERTVAELVGRGLTNKQTGRRLFMSPHTVDAHLRRVYRKLGITSRVELARLLGEHQDVLASLAVEDLIA
jgi:DNA-binding CsgD family transcriptional regulator